MTAEKTCKIGFIGAGNMAYAICKSIINAGLYSSEEISIYDVDLHRLNIFKDEFSVNVDESNSSLTRKTQCIILAVKPQHIAQVLDEIQPNVRESQLIISIAAGISTKYIETRLGKAIPVIRTMPNTPLMYGAGTTALCKGQYANDKHLEFAQKLFRSAGLTLVVEEEMMDAITALSGSGPAYFFYLVEAMIQSAIELGLDAELAKKLSANTGLGAMKMLMQSQSDPQELRRRVTSPGGTTESAISVLEAENVKRSFIEAIKSAAKRSKQLGL